MQAQGISCTGRKCWRFTCDYSLAFRIWWAILYQIEAITELAEKLKRGLAELKRKVAVKADIQGTAPAHRRFPSN